MPSIIVQARSLAILLPAQILTKSYYCQVITASDWKIILISSLKIIIFLVLNSRVVETTYEKDMYKRKKIWGIQ